jgi:hypothetical protein
VRVRSDSTGRALICAPPDRAITIKVAYRDINSGNQTTSLTLGRSTSHTSSIDAPSAFVRGTVIDQETGQPVPSVSVRIVNTMLARLTNGDGKFFFERIPIGDYNLQVEHLAYTAISTLLKVRDDDLDAQIRLTPAAIPLQPITVMAFSRRLERAGFYERQKRGMGTFIGRKQVDAMKVQTASDLLRFVPGVRIVPQAMRRNVPRNTTGGRGNCRFRFILDGTRTLGDFEMDYVAPGAIEGVEVYNGLAEIPALFRPVMDGPGSATCGVIAIWTRDGR